MEMPREEGFSFSLTFPLPGFVGGRMKRKKNKTHLLLPFLLFFFLFAKERGERVPPAAAAG